MTLQDRVVLEIDELGDAEGDGVFHFQSDLEIRTSMDRSYLLAERGQYATELVDQLPGSFADPITGADIRRREGYHIDGGAGSHNYSISADRGREEQGTQWGDGSALTGQTNEFDATHGGINAVRDVLDNWLNETRSDSGGQTRLHIGEWTDGTYSDDPGLFGEPITVAVLEHAFETPSPANEISMTLELQRTATLPDIRGALEGIYDDITDIVEDAAEGIGEWVPDW